MGAQRRMQRQAQAGKRELTGAVDLGQLRAPVREITDEQRKEGARQILQQAGLLCQCGRKVADEGRVLFLVREQIFPTEHGPEPGLQIIQATFCSEECPNYQVALQNDPPPVAIMHSAKVDWLLPEVVDEDSFEIGQRVMIQREFPTPGTVVELDGAAVVVDPDGPNPPATFAAIELNPLGETLNVVDEVDSSLPVEDAAEADEETPTLDVVDG